MLWLTISSSGFARSAPSPSVVLNNGVSMPLLSFGANVWDAATCKTATTAAIAAGFRMIWSSQLVGGDCQTAQGQAIAASSVPRAELFVAGTADTMECSTHDDCYSRTVVAAEAQYGFLNVTTLDMLMLDYPSGSPGCGPVTGQWRAFEELYAAKRVRTIAVSNFSPEQLQCIASNKSATVPAVNQMNFHVGSGLQVLSDDAALGVVVQAYSALDSGGSLLSAPLLQSIGKAHSKSAAQVALKWILQHNATVNTQSTDAAYLKEDVELFDFMLSPDEMKQLDAYEP
tara:strand:- start:390 stop:1247 length:858 start_codon:yes stop_codon:yes gene_type:complete